MAGKIDAFLKLSIVAGVLLASSSVAYYYVIYLPDRDARIDANNGAAEQRRAEEKAAAEQRRSDEQVDAQMRYDRGIRQAQETYDATWASNCRLKGQSAAQRHTNCIVNGADKELCDKMYDRERLVDSSPNCSLPSSIAESLDASLNKARDRCLQASKAGL